MIAGVCDAQFLGRPFLAVPRSVQDIRCDDNLGDPTRNAIRTPSVKVRPWTDTRFGNRRKDWEEIGTQNEPDRADMHLRSKLLDIVSAGPRRWKKLIVAVAPFSHLVLKDGSDPQI